jgi:tRNA threonylcarbamoyladenosine biosynthesis protein TsaE
MKRSRPKQPRNQETIVSRSPEDTEKIGSELAAKIVVPGVILLRGDLGSGKTTLTRGIARGLGLKDSAVVNSPSFTLVNIYQGDCTIYHVDLYRLQNDRDLYSTGIDDFLGQDGVTIVEWSERLSRELQQAIHVEIEDAGEDRRILRVVHPWASRRTRPGNEEYSN